CKKVEVPEISTAKMVRDSAAATSAKDSTAATVKANFMGLVLLTKAADLGEQIVNTGCIQHFSHVPLEGGFRAEPGWDCLGIGIREDCGHRIRSSANGKQSTRRAELAEANCPAGMRRFSGELQLRINRLRQSCSFVLIC